MCYWTIDDPKENQKRIIKCIETNKNVNTAYQNSRDSGKAVLRWKFIVRRGPKMVEE